MKTVKGEDILFAMNNIDDRYVRKAGKHLGVEERGGGRKMRRRVRTLLLVALISCFLGVTAYAAGEIYEYRSLREDPALQKQAEQGAQELERFTHTGLPITAEDTALYMNNERGQSGVTDFMYHVEGTDAWLSVEYYDTGEIETLDARQLYMLDWEEHEYPFQWFDEHYPDRAAYKERLIEAAPGLIDELHADGWIGHSSADIEKAGILDIHVFWDTYAQIRVLMKDGCAYELWLQPDTFAIEGFMFWKPEDAAIIRNGFFPALRDDRLEEWWEELMAVSVG